MTTHHLSLCLLSTAFALCAQGCYHTLATHEELLLDSASVKFSRGDYAGVIRDLTQAIGLNPEDGGLYHDRGRAKGALGDLRGAMIDFDSAAKFRPWDAEVFRSRVNTRLDILDSLQRLVPDSLTGDRVLLRMQIVTTRIFLFDDLDRLLEIDPEDTRARGERGMKRFELGDAQRAIDDFTSVLEVEPGADWARYNRGLAASTLGDYPAAIRDFTKILGNDTTDGWAYYQRGLARIYSGDQERGCSDLRRARALGVEESESAMEELCL